MLEMLKNYDVVMETPFTTENFMDEVLANTNSPAMQVINLAFANILRQALQDGWKPGAEKLGDFVHFHVEDVPLHDINPDLQDYEVDEDDLSVFGLLNKFGDAYADGGCMPLMTFRDKKTGESYRMEDVDIREFLDMNEIERLFGGEE